MIKKSNVAHLATLHYTNAMITHIHHTGLEKFYRTGNTAGINAIHAKALRFVLLTLDSAYFEQDLALPNMQLQQDGEAYCLSAEFGSIRFHFKNAAVEIVEYLSAE